MASATMASTRPATLPPAILLVYPATLLLGTIFSIISPTARSTRNSLSRSTQPSAPLAPSLAADLHLSESQVNYFARKNNVFNVYFVKIGWLWTTLAFISILLFQPAFRPSPTCRPPPSQAQQQQPQPTRLRRSLQALLRFTLATAVWYLTTQWCFGPAIIDRSFVITGGKCEQALHEVGKIRSSSAGSSATSPVQLETLFAAAACKAAGGAWRGGHDISGHVLMLVLATAALAFEAVGAGAPAPAWLTGRGTGHGDATTRERKASDPQDFVGESTATISAAARMWSSRLVWGVVGLGWWMLLQTAIWFHTWLEKVGLGS